MPQIRNDEPINSVINDLFGFSFQASMIAKLVGGKDSQNHLSVGVSGSWGSGKTSLLNMVRELLNYQNFVEEKDKLEKARNSKWIHETQKESYKKRIDQINIFIDHIKNNGEIFGDIKDVISKPVKVIWFDPWFFGSEETVIKAFFYRIAKELVDEDRELSKLFLKLAVVMSSSPELPDSLPVVGNTFKVINYGRNLLSWMSGDDGSVMDFTDIKRKICERLETNEFTYTDDEDDTKKKTRKRIVIIIDDLDRLQVSEALTMLKVIRLVTEFGINFVIGYDEKTLSATINKNCGGHGREYIRKMINAPLAINLVCQQDLFDFTLKSLWNEAEYNILLEGPYEIYDNNEVTEVLREKITTLRLAKNLINLYKVNYLVLSKQVDPIDYLGLCLIYLFFPNCYLSLKYLTNLEKYNLKIEYLTNIAEIEHGIEQFHLITVSHAIFNTSNRDGKQTINDKSDFLNRIISVLFIADNNIYRQVASDIDSFKDEKYPYDKKISFLDRHRYYFGLMPSMKNTNQE